MEDKQEMSESNKNNKQSRETKAGFRPAACTL